MFSHSLWLNSQRKKSFLCHNMQKSFIYSSFGNNTLIYFTNNFTKPQLTLVCPIFTNMHWTDLLLKNSAVQKSSTTSNYLMPFCLQQQTKKVVHLSQRSQLNFNKTQKMAAHKRLITFLSETPFKMDTFRNGRAQLILLNVLLKITLYRKWTDKTTRIN